MCSVNILLEICAFSKVKTKCKQIFYGKYISQVNNKGQGDRQAFSFNRKESIGIGECIGIGLLSCIGIGYWYC